MPHFFPRSISQFGKWAPSEEACTNYLAKRRWPRGFVCPACARWDAQQPFSVTGKALWQCRVCAHQTSVTARTALHRTRIPLSVWLRAIYLVGAVARFRVYVTRSRYGSYAPIKEFHSALGGVAYSTAWEMFARLDAAVRRLYSDGERLRGRPRITREVLIAVLQPV